MKRLIIILLLAVFSVAGSAELKPLQAPGLSAVIKTQAEAMVRHLMKSEFKQFVGFMYPEAVKMLGGEQKLVETLKRDAGKLNIVSVTFGEPSKVITAGNELQCTIPETLVTKTDEGKLTNKSTLIAVSKDKGKHWYFIAASGKSIDEMRKMLPNLSKALVIPKPQQPVLSKD